MGREGREAGVRYMASTILLGGFCLWQQRLDRECKQEDQLRWREDLML